MNGILVDSYHQVRVISMVMELEDYTSSAILSDLLNLQNEDLSNNFLLNCQKK